MALRDRKIRPDRVAIYIRWSTDDQSDGTTLEVQLDGCRHYLLSQGWTVREDLVFVDDGYSGGTLDRPALSRLREKVRRGQIDCIVVFKLDRLSRSVIDMVKLVLEEWEDRTHVKSAREPVDTSSAMGKQFFYMLVSFAEWERNVIRERTTAGRQARAREGYKPSAIAPFGYRHGERRGSLEIEETEAPLVRRIFDLYARGSGAAAIAAGLNEEGARFRGGTLFNERTLLYLLSNPVYTGRAVYGRTARNPRRGKEQGERFWLKSETPTVVEKSPYIPPLVDETLFAQVQVVKAERRPQVTPARSLGSDHLLTGLARCRCGSSLYAKSTGSFIYYACLGKKTRGAAFCGSGNIGRSDLDRKVEAEVLTRYGDRLVREEYQVSVQDQLEKEAAHLAGSAGQAEREIADLRSQEQRIRLDYRRRRLDAEEFHALKQEIERDLLGAQQRLGLLRQRQTELQLRQAGVGARLAALGQVERWASLSPHEQKHLLRHFMESVTVWIEPANRKAELQIVWRSQK